MTFWNRESHGDIKEISGVSVEEGMKRQKAENFQGRETILYDIMVDIYDNTFVKTHRMYNIKAELMEFG